MNLPPLLTNEVLQVFETLPDLYLILSPNLLILTASQSYLEATFTQREAIVGKPIFEVFPDNPATPQANSVRNLSASLQEAIATKKPHRMPVQHYDVPRPGGGFEEKYWNPLNTPVLNQDGQVQYLIHRVEDVTEQVKNAIRVKTLQEQQADDKALIIRQRNLLQALLDQVPVGIGYFEGEEQRVSLANPLICQMWGYAAEQVLGKPLIEGVPELQGQGFDELIREVWRTGNPFVGKEVAAYLRHNGELQTKYFNFSYKPLRDEQNHISGVLDVVIDVTEAVLARQQVQALNQELAAANEEMRTTNEELATAKAALEQLNSELERRVEERTRQLTLAQGEAQRQQARLERFFRQAPAAICMLGGPELVYEFVNPDYQQLFPGRDLLGKPILEALPELAGTAVLKTFHQVYQYGHTHREQALLIRIARPADGLLEDRYFTYIQQGRYNETGQIDGVLVFAFEVTDLERSRQQVEQLASKVEQQSQTFERLLTALQDFVYTFDTQGRFTYANQPLLDLLGISLAEIVGKTFYELPYPNELAKSLQAQIQQVLRTGEPLQADTPYTNPEGKVGYYEYIFMPVFDARHQVVLVAGSTRDITRRKAAEEALSQKNGELLRINVDLDNFIYSASHDLKAPISNIEGLMQLLLRSLPPEAFQSERVRKSSEMIAKAIERFKKTIAHLTEVTKLQKESNQLLVPVDLSKVIQEVRLDLESQLDETKAVLNIDVSSCPWVHFSEKNLRSIVYNLFSNAIKYRSPERTPFLEVHCQDRGSFIVLLVGDNGIGMDLSKENKLFTMFGRLHNHVEGSGIGLYMVKKMVENVGGKIEVTSQLGVGSTFTLYFPKMSETE